MFCSSLLDANLAVLFAVGLADRNYIAKHKNLSSYDTTDFDIVSGLIAKSSGIVFTPNVLTETSNLVRQIGNPIKEHVSQSLANIVNKSTEQYIESRTAVEHLNYVRLGLTDAVLLTLQASGASLITADLALYLSAANAGFNSINYNHLREQRPDFR